MIACCSVPSTGTRPTLPRLISAARPPATRFIMAHPDRGDSRWSAEIRATCRRTPVIRRFTNYIHARAVTYILSKSVSTAELRSRRTDKRHCNRLFSTDKVEIYYCDLRQSVTRVTAIRCYERKLRNKNRPCNATVFHDGISNDISNAVTELRN